MTKIVVVDYGVGNLLSITRAIKSVGADVLVTNDPDGITHAEKLILPGVGSFGYAMQELDSRRLIDPIKEYASSGRPFMGICLGMQLMFDRSEEFGVHAGLGIIPGSVDALPQFAISGKPHKIPHIGWNEIIVARENGWSGSILSKISQNIPMYFVHSYAGAPTFSEHILAETNYNGQVFCSVVKMGNLYGFQGHPEKSGQHGLEIIRAFHSMRDR